MITKKLSKKSQALFWAKVRKTEYCWEWVAAKNEKGYGVFGIGKETDKAHRIAWRLLVGSIPKYLFCCHRCDNPACVNPGHLFLGTNKDNVDDMIRKGRNSPPPYMAGHNRLTLPKACLNQLGKKPDYILGEQFGVSKYTIARNRHVKGIPSYASMTGNDGRFKSRKQ
ncbi:MAG: HNH endonuclease [Chlorobiales bacterium]|nr:HNH endonuclease [Chlorobiales bacterium]